MKVFCYSLLAMTLLGCAHKMEKKIESDIVKQPEVTSRQAVDAGREAIATSKSLTSEQKEKMLILMDESRLKIESVRRKESQVKSSLFKYFASGSFDEREIRIYRKKLIDFENQKIKIMFAGLKQTRKILGKEIETNPDLPEILDFQRLHADLN